ncbi:MAG: DUF4287 domain-containing protein [Candidatus Kapaibacterium sp.]|jgi:predicted transport protein|nr:DUF4287 domain-containing protein [Candidatus Kapabacteria bacterium]
MDKGLLTMIENLKKNTGKSLEDWIEDVKSHNFTKHGEIIKYLKGTHGLTHGYANLIAHKSKESVTDAANHPEDLISKQYKGKELFLPIYEKLLSEILKFGDDIEIAPKSSYVSLRRNKQFAILNPATKTRYEIGLNLKGQGVEGKLELEKPNSMCTHKIKIADINDIDNEVMSWIKKAYDNS